MSCQKVSSDTTSTIPPCTFTETRSEQDTCTFPCAADADMAPVPHASYTNSDIRVIRNTLRHHVPTEVADIILDLADIHPYISASRNAYTTASSALGASDGDAEWCYLITPAIPSLGNESGKAVPTEVKNVKIFVKSYQTQWDPSAEPLNVKLWFEACILKPSECANYSPSSSPNPNDWYTALSPTPKLINSFYFDEDEATPHPFDSKPRYQVTSNASWSKNEEWSEITWSASDDSSCGSFVRSLEVGDRVMVLSRAEYPGWIDQVHHVRVQVDYGMSGF